MINKTISLVFTLSLLGFNLSCAKKDNPANNQKTPSAAQPHKENKKKKELPVLKLPEIPEQPAIKSFSDAIISELKEESPAFPEAITLKWNQYGSWFYPHLYTLEKAYLGPEDDSTFFFSIFGTEDDIKIESPWSVISADLKSFRVYGGEKAGEGTPIGYIQWDGKEMKLVLHTEYEVSKEESKIVILPPKNIPVANMENCPLLVKQVNLCEPYIHTYNAFSSIDYKAFGEAGPGIAKDVIRFKTIFSLTKSAWLFEASIDEIRDSYLIPILKSINNLKKLGDANKENRQQYIKQTQETYSQLIITSVDSIIKTQKMMPEALGDLGQTGFGVLLAYVGEVLPLT